MDHRDTSADPPRRPGRPPNEGPRAVPVTTTMPAPLRDWLRRFAVDREVPMAQIVTRALLEYRSREDVAPAETGGTDDADADDRGSAGDGAGVLRV